MKWRDFRRVPAALLAAWSLVVEVGPLGVHACPMHDQAAHAVASAPEHHARPAEHGGHVVSLAANPSSQDHDGGRQHSRCCTCVGPCCTASPAALVLAEALLPVSVVAVEAQLPTVGDVHIPVATDHLRPPALGPPLSYIG